MHSFRVSVTFPLHTTTTAIRALPDIVVHVLVSDT